MFGWLSDKAKQELAAHDAYLDRREAELNASIKAKQAQLQDLDKRCEDLRRSNAQLREEVERLSKAVKRNQN